MIRIEWFYVCVYKSNGFFVYLYLLPKMMCMMQMKSFEVRSPLLNAYIKHYFVLEFSGEDERLSGEMTVPPVGYPVLQFHFGRKVNFYRHRHLTCQSVFIGQVTRHVVLYPSSGVRIFGVNFRPYGLYHLLGISPRHFLNSGVESDTFFGSLSVERIITTLSTQSIEAGIDAIEELLLNHQNRNIQTHPYFDAIVDRLEEENGLVDYVELLGRQVSRRTFQRYFREVIGLSPKMFCQVLRHKYIMELLYKNPEMSWSDVALNGFYYDFSHFTKDFSHFSGLTPKRYLPIKNSFASALLD